MNRNGTLEPTRAIVGGVAPKTRGARHVSDVGAYGSPLEVRSAASGSDAVVFSGYGALFDAETVIRDWFGTYTEVVRRGAFTKTIAERGTKANGGNGQIKGLYKHRGELAIAFRFLDLREDERGLWFEGETIDTDAGRNLAAELRAGVVDTMSFGFDVIREAWNEEEQKRELLEVRLYELSPVNWPAYADSKIDTVRAEIASGDLKAGVIALLAEVRSGRPLTTEGRAAIAEVRDLLNDVLEASAPEAPAEKPAEDDDATSTEPPVAGTPEAEPPVAGTPDEDDENEAEAEARALRLRMLERASDL